MELQQVIPDVSDDGQCIHQTRAHSPSVCVCDRVRHCLCLQAPNRRVQRLMEKENKKLRSASKKKRNETVRVRMTGLDCVHV